MTNSTKIIFPYLGVYLLGATLAGGMGYAVLIGNSTLMEAFLLVLSFGLILTIFGYFILDEYEEEV